MTLTVDAAKLRDEVKKKYVEVAEDPSGDHHFHMGRTLANKLRYQAEVP